MTDLTLFYKIIHSLVSISLPVDFTVAEPTQVRYTRNTANIVNCKDNTSIKCSIKPKCDSFRNLETHFSLELCQSGTGFHVK